MSEAVARHGHPCTYKSFAAQCCHGESGKAQRSAPDRRYKPLTSRRRATEAATSSKAATISAKARVLVALPLAWFFKGHDHDNERLLYSMQLSPLRNSLAALEGPLLPIAVLKTLSRHSGPHTNIFQTCGRFRMMVCLTCTLRKLQAIF